LFPIYVYSYVLIFFADEPIVSGNVFASRMGMKGEMPDGTIMPMDEIAVYTVKDGKIIREEFFLHNVKM